MESIKCVVVGDGTVGKTCLLIAYTMKAFPQDYVPTVFDNYNAVVQWDGRPINLGLWDTAGQDDFEHMRPISYVAADIFLLFFAIDNPTSYHNIKHKWFPEVRRQNPDVPLLLVGTKSDIRDNEKQLEELSSKGIEIVTWKQGVKLAKELNCITYIECSAIQSKGFMDIFGQTILTIVNVRKNKKPGAVCWNTECNHIFSVLSKKNKCIRCGHRYCNDHMDCLPKDHEFYPSASICTKCKIIDQDEGPMIKPKNRGGIWGFGRGNKKSQTSSNNSKNNNTSDDDDDVDDNLTSSNFGHLDDSSSSAGGGAKDLSNSRKGSWKGKSKDKKKSARGSTPNFSS